MDFKVLEETGVAQGEFAKLVPVSRATVNSWASGRSHPNSKRVKKVRQLLLVLRMARDKRMLPERLTPVKQSEQGERMRIIKATIAAIVNEAKTK
jgi:predicted DNA-binding protein (UPF0251 family)